MKVTYNQELNRLEFFKEEEQQYTAMFIDLTWDGYYIANVLNRIIKDE